MEAPLSTGREEKLIILHKSKGGVKGIADSGITKIPEIFVQPPELLPQTPYQPPLADELTIPLIDLSGIETCEEQRKAVVNEMGKAASTWGFFQMVNHGIPVEVIEGLLGGVMRFHEQPEERKIEYYSGEGSIRFITNDKLDEGIAANWRDSLGIRFEDDNVDSNILALPCRKEIEEYMKYMVKLKKNMCELLSEALGLKRDYLSSIECMENQFLLCHYYPPCPEPYRTLGLNKHSDLTFLTILSQNDIGGLQVLHKQHWVDVPTTPGNLIANIGDIMQLITNDKFKSVEHRVIAKTVGPRISAACFFQPKEKKTREEAYGPLKELLNNKNPPIYRQVMYNELLAMKGKKNALDESSTSVLSNFML